MQYNSIQGKRSWWCAEEQFNESQTNYGPLQTSRGISQREHSAQLFQVPNFRGHDIIDEAILLHGGDRSEGCVQTYQDCSQRQRSTVFPAERNILPRFVHEFRPIKSSCGIQSYDQSDMGPRSEEFQYPGYRIPRRILSHSSLRANLSQSNESAYHGNRRLRVQNKLGQADTTNNDSQIFGSRSMLKFLDSFDPQRKSVVTEGGAAGSQGISKDIFQKTAIVGGQVKLLCQSSQRSQNIYETHDQLLNLEERKFRGEMELRSDLLKDVDWWLMTLDVSPLQSLIQVGLPIMSSSCLPASILL